MPGRGRKRRRAKTRRRRASPSSTARREASPVLRRSSAKNQIEPPGAAGRACAPRGRNHDHGGRLILRDAQADSIAVGWAIFNRPNRTMGAALKLGSKGPFPWFGTRPKPGLEPNPRLGRSALKDLEKFVIFLVLAGLESDSNILSNVPRRILARFLTHSGIRLRSDFS